LSAKQENFMHWIDPQSLPAVEGTVTQLIMNRDGELDGLLLLTRAGETRLVDFPPHMGGEVERTVRVGGGVTVFGVRPRGAEVIAAVSLMAPSGAVIIDRGPMDRHAESASAGDRDVRHGAEAAGCVRISLCGPKGELRGAILEDGTVIRIGKKEAARFAYLLQPGAFLAARGSAIVGPHGTMLDVEALGGAAIALQPVREKANEPQEPTPAQHARTEA
jgi:hypothetical protein